MDEIERYNNACDEVERLTSEIEERTALLERAQYRVAISYMPAFRRLLRIHAEREERLPTLKTGPKPKKKPGPNFRIVLKDGLSAKERRDRKVLEEFQRRQAANPGQSIKSLEAEMSGEYWRAGIRCGARNYPVYPECQWQ